MKMNVIDIVYLILPLIFWPLSFIVLKNEFIYALAASTAVLAAFSIYRYRNQIKWIRIKKRHIAFLAGLIGALLLYIIFLFGSIITSKLGLGPYVSNVYTSIYGTQGRGVTTIFLLAIIGIFEEIYWRGGVQSLFEAKSKIFKSIPWIASTAYYTLVHFATLNPILVIAAFVVGIATSILAYKFGILASTVTHILWIEAVVVFLPL